MEIRKYREADIPAMLRIWNRVVEEGVAFPQEEYFDKESGRKFFAEQSYCGVAEDDGSVVGLYILHPNNIGRLGGISNASLRWIMNVAAGISGKSWCRTALRKPKGLDLIFYSSTPL